MIKIYTTNWCPSCNYAKKLFDELSHPRIDKISLPINFGFNTSVNFYIRDYINNENLPKKNNKKK